MTVIAGTSAPSGAERAAPRPIGLSTRLILLMIGFIALAELIIFVPALASFRQGWLSDRLMGSQMIALALTASPGNELPGNLEEKLLSAVRGAEAIGVRAPGTRWFVVNTSSNPPAAATAEADMRVAPWYGTFRGLFRTLASGPNDTLRVISSSAPGIEGIEWVELVIREAPLKAALGDFSKIFLLLSLLILAGVAGLLYLALHLLVISPVRRLSANIADFAANPEDSSRIIRPSGRTDEIGTAEFALSRMETSLATELRQKRRLAELGLAVSKVNHELRNMLTTAQLLGDRLEQARDPAVLRIAPRLVKTINRAVAFCTATLAYGRVVEPSPERTVFPLRPLVQEQLDLTDGDEVRVVADVADTVMVDADREQLGRALLNVTRNAAEALLQSNTPDPTIRVSAVRDGDRVLMRVGDNGPGVPARLRARLFTAFQASERSGGTGLGLPVADELLRLHGGSIVLEDATTGASFLLTIPDRPKA